MEKGTKVKFSNPENEEEAALVMIVIEDRDTRVLVETPLPNFGAELMPQSVYAKSDLAVIERVLEILCK